MEEDANLRPFVNRYFNTLHHSLKVFVGEGNTGRESQDSPTNGGQANVAPPLGRGMGNARKLWNDPTDVKPKRMDPCWRPCGKVTGGTNFGNGIHNFVPKTSMVAFDMLENHRDLRKDG